MDYFDFEPEEDLPAVDLVDDSLADALLPDVADWLLPLPLPPLPELLAVPVSSTLLLPPFLPPWVGLLIIFSWDLTGCAAEVFN
ncbi:hypothetical protein [Duganella sp. CF517]|uniref:hypothetical protein n=1 Tax=Duganella sp. CF517 TaxID=1881038 RepID=UPI0011609451|nr:hypothetical protein [Duganella sp. CF517]